MALVVVLMLISILGLLFGLGGRGNGPSLQTAGESNARNIAYFTAQGALQRGLTELRLDPAYGGKTNGKFPGAGGSTFDIKVVRNTGNTPKRTPAGVDIAPGSTLVMATGRAGSSERVVAGIVEEAAATSNGFAALVEGELRVRGGVVGAFSAPNGFAIADLVEEPGKAQLGSLNQEIIIETRVPSDGTADIPARVEGSVASADVDGDINTPEPGVYSVEAGSQLAGETKLDNRPTIDPPPAAPAYLGGPDVLKAAGSRTLLPGHYGRLQTDNDAEIFLEPGDYYFADSFKTYGTSKIHANGEVRIFVKGSFTSDDDSFVNYNGDPRNCEIILTGSPNATSGKVGWVSHASYVWARVKPLNGTLGISGTLFGDVQGGGVDVIGDPDGSGALHYFTELGEEGGGGGDIGLGGGELRYATTWTVK